MKLRIAAVLTLISTLTGCGSMQIDSTDAKVTPNKFIDLQAHWIKDKPKKWDVEMAIINKSETDLIIMLNDIQCSRGQISGQLRHTFFNTGERTIDFRKGQTKILRLVCDTGVPSKGEFKITVNRVYDNPSADGAGKGKVIADRITWSFIKD